MGSRPEKTLVIKPEPISQAKPVCFIHIGKTGGTTLTGLLDTLVDSSKICPARHMDELELLSDEEISSYGLFRGHFWHSASERLPASTRFFSFLRDPVERVVSTYDHIRQHPHGRHHIVSKLSLEEYIDSPNSISLEVDNWQARVLSSCIEPEDEPSWDVAMDNLSRLALVGITERMSDSIKLMSAAFDFPFNGNCKSLNITKNRTIRSSLSERLVEKINKKNKLDARLYLAGKERLQADLCRSL